MKKSILAAALASTALVGCGGNTLRYAGVEREASDEGLQEAGVVEIRCNRPVPSNVSALAAAGIGIAVDTAIGAISKSLANAQKARTGSWTASNSTAFFASGCSDGNMKVQRGVFKEGVHTTDLSPAFDLDANVSVQSSNDPNTMVVTVSPNALTYSETSARNRGKGRKEVTLGISVSTVGAVVSVPKPKNATDGKSASSTKPKDDDKAAKKPEPATANILNLGRLEIGKKYSKLNSSVSFVVPKGVRHNVSIVVTESEDPSVVLEAFAAAFESNKSDLGKALKDAIGGSDD